jgi:hypothetical protein
MSYRVWWRLIFFKIDTTLQTSNGLEDDERNNFVTDADVGSGNISMDILQDKKKPSPLVRKAFWKSISVVVITRHSRFCPAR